MKISTRTGDKGETSLFSGRRVSKSSEVIELLGSIDELTSLLGACRFVIGHEGGKKVCKMIDRIQDDLYRIMSIIGFEMKAQPHIKEISDKDIVYLESEIERLEVKIGEIKEFVKPGRTEAASRFHIARSVCRRCERRAVLLSQEGMVVPELILVYLNRLSDLLFLLAIRYEK